MRFFFKALIKAPLIYILLATGAWATEPIILSDDVEEYSLGLQYDCLDDKDKQWNIRDVSNGPAMMLFIAANQPDRACAASLSSFWLRFTLQNPLMHNVDLNLESYYSLVDILKLYIPNNIGGFLEKQVGDNVPMFAHEAPHPHLVFEISIPAEKTVTLYLLVENGDVLPFSLHLLTKENQTKRDIYLWIFYGAYITFLLAVALYNLVLYISRRELFNLHFTVFIICWLFSWLALHRLDVLYFAQDARWLPHRWYIPALILTLVSGMVFTREFLSTHKAVAKFDVVLRWYIRLNVLLFLFAFLLPWQASVGQMTNISVIFFNGLLLLSWFLVWRRNGPKVGGFLISWVFVNIGVLVYYLTLFGIVPFSFLALHSVDISVLVAAIVLCIGLRSNMEVNGNR